MDKKAKEVTMPQATVQQKEKISVEKEYLQYRLDELIKTHSNVISEYSYLMSVLSPVPAKLVTE